MIRQGRRNHRPVKPDAGAGLADHPGLLELSQWMSPGTPAKWPGKRVFGGLNK
jgi:hypothetical protein